MRLLRTHQENKPVVMLYLAVPKRCNNESQNGIIVPASAYKFRITNPWGTTFEAWYTPLNGDDILGDKESLLFLSEEDELLKFFISLRPGGQITRPCMTWKVGKTIPILGPTVNPMALHTIDSNKSSQPVVMFAAGAGIAPIMLQMIDFYAVPKRAKHSPFLFLVWILKSPIHNYEEFIGLEEKVNALTKRNKSRFKWVVLYTSSKSKKKKESQKEGSKKKEQAKEMIIGDLSEPAPKSPRTSGRS